MRLLFNTALCALAIAFVPASASASSDTPVPLSEYGQLPSVEEAVLSPSGKRIAYISTVNGERKLVAIEDQTKVIQAAPIGDIKVRYLQWIGDDRLLLVTSQTEDLGYNFTTDKAEFYIARVLPMAQGIKGDVIFGNQRNLVDAIIGNYGIRQIDGKFYGFYGAIELKREGRMKYRFDHGRPFLYRVDLEDFSVKRVAGAARPGFDNDWLIDAKGQVAATIEINENTGAWKLRGPDQTAIVEGKEAGGRVWLVGLGYA